MMAMIGKRMTRGSGSRVRRFQVQRRERRAEDPLVKMGNSHCAEPAVSWLGKHPIFFPSPAVEDAVHLSSAIDLT